MKRCRGIIQTKNKQEPIARCGAQTDRSLCKTCSQDPAQPFWTEVLRENWHEASTLKIRPSTPKKKKPPTGLMNRQEARRILLGG